MKRRPLISKLPKSINLTYSSLKLYLDKVQNYKRLKKKFLSRLNYPLNIESPLSFNEKIQWKKLNDRNPLLPVTADKLSVRSYLVKVLGENQANRILIPLYFETENPEKIIFENLPDEFVIKPNHGSHMHLIFENKNNIVPDDVIKECKKWLKVHHGYYNYEWAYKNIKRKIIIEKLLKTSDGGLPLDYKFFCFHGKCSLIRAQFNRFNQEVRTGYFSTQWDILPISRPGYDAVIQNIAKPGKLREMIKIAEKLSENFDAVRIDLYNCDGNIYFSETTHYDFNGFVKFEPESFDFELGKYWRLEKEYWKKGNIQTFIKNNY